MTEIILKDGRLFRGKILSKHKDYFEIIYHEDEVTYQVCIPQDLIDLVKLDTGDLLDKIACDDEEFHKKQKEMVHNCVTVAPSEQSVSFKRADIEPILDRMYGHAFEGDTGSWNHLQEMLFKELGL